MNDRAGARGGPPGGQAEMVEDLGDYFRFYDGGDDLHGSTTVRAVFDIDIEYPFE